MSLSLSESILKKIIQEEIRDILKEHKGKPLSTGTIKQKNLARKRDENSREYSAEKRKNQRAIMIGYDELKRLGKGILEENEIQELDSDESNVSINRLALQRLLTENSAQLETTCKKAGFHKLEYFLNIQNAFSDASKGKFGEK
jgi:hypothetical protein